jgi:acyl carrier protein
MTTAEIFSKLTDILRDVFDDDQLVAVPQMTAADVEGWDSLSNLRLIMTTERTFQVKFSAADIGKLKNLGELATLIERKLTA